LPVRDGKFLETRAEILQPFDDGQNCLPRFSGILYLPNLRGLETEVFGIAPVVVTLPAEASNQRGLLSAVFAVSGR
jgi:hypothetical protein